MHRPATRAAAAVALALLLCLSLWATTSFAATAREVGTAQESWYHASPADLGEEDPTCTLPIGCAPQPSAPIQPYPEETLHVGIAAGRDTARTFLTLDLAQLPVGALITGGTLTLPVLQDEDSGSMRPETAELRACAVIGAVKKARGGAADEQPEYSCETTAKTTYQAGKDGAPPTLSVDLAPLAATLATGGVAIVPTQGAQEEGATWHVAFPAREHDSKQQITARLEYDAAPALAPVLPPAVPAGDSGAPAGDASVTGGDSFAPPADAGASGPVGALDEPATDAGVAPAPAAAPRTAEQPVVAGAAPPVATTPVAVVGGYAYPGVWLAPLVLVGVSGMLARCLAGEIELPNPRSDGGAVAREANLIERLTEALWPSRPVRSAKT